MARVFISFVHEDEAVAKALRSVIAWELALGAQVFMISDQNQVLAGADWLARIRQELHAAEVVVMMSRAPTRR
jgi:hypothetical protein